MTGREIAALIGRTGKLTDGAIKWGVEINDARETWGVTECLISPVSGTGSMWLPANSVDLDD